MLVDMSSDLERVGKVADLLGVDGDPLRHGDGWSNCAWLYPDVVIRVASRAGPGTLHQEAALAPRLPPEVGYPRLLGHGVIDGHEWMAQVRLPGDNLAAVWPVRQLLGAKSRSDGSAPSMTQRVRRASKVES